MSYKLTDYFRCVETEGTWTFDVGLVRWLSPYEPSMHWQPFRRWKTPPGKARLQRARTAAMRDRRFYRTCEHCHEVCNAGHMHDRKTCQGCAERYLGVVH